LKGKIILVSLVTTSVLLSIPSTADKKVLLKLLVNLGTHLEGLGSALKWLTERQGIFSGN